MSDAIFRVPPPENEPILSYAPGSPEKASIKSQIEKMAGETIDIPLIIGGKEVRTGNLEKCVMPHDHNHVLGHYHQADASHVEAAADAAAKARVEWSEYPWQERAAVFLKAAELLAGPYRDIINGATMLGQSKTVFQAEIDSACELIDFFKFNAHFLNQIIGEQPMYSPSPTWNRCEYRGLEGFIFAITPFNFTSIAGNLPSAPALMGNTALWKPSHSAVYSGYYLMKLFEEAGLPAGVINFIPGPSQEVGPTAMNRADLAGIHFTGSTGVFQHLWKSVGDNIHKYNAYPRIVGETGGKDFVFAHESADVDALKIALVRGAFEFQGQKCSAASRAYIPKDMWEKLKPALLEEIATIKMGDVRDFTNFMGAVIDRRAYDKHKSYIDHANESNEAQVIAGGDYDDSKGFFIPPTVIETTNPEYKSMREEIFGPILTVYPYDPAKLDETLALCDTTSPYALTGAIFAQDRKAIMHASNALKNAAGNFYINDKPTGAVVGQQPFGGGRASGTNDKAGSMLNLLRWTSVRSIKENFRPPYDYRYPFMSEA